ncbi:hypothetical protein MUB18_14795 [Sphingobacterium sp. PCS056]|uniref:hypothetical protein n=1 Tax=Sphingobacterium sp. PCS056 TaxID=2931400 RepID=UPI00200F90A5|nr:hypothetical protein [Sphingobacterium sp. PCS056]UPZ35375.1 hypothetical protein MUB18_14795 [Sphingobacterium sp. PCS056]
MRVYSFIITIFLLLQSSALISQDLNDENTLRDIVFMRTEGLVMTQLMEKHTTDKQMLLLCKRIKDYYKTTQPILLEIVKGKTLQLDQRQFDQIWKAGEKSFENYNEKNKKQWKLLFEQHIHACVQAYTKLLQERQDDDISYFSFQALPELVNLADACKQMQGE